MRTILVTPRLFIPSIVRSTVEPERSGVYVLGRDAEGFVAGYVGRSDTCLRTRLLTHEHLYDLEYFIFAYAKDSLASFKMECEFWHASVDSRALRNRIHPGAPSGSRARCTYCEFADRMRTIVPSIAA